jgi:hypothetical protein
MIGQTLSALNHPNVGAIYGLEEAPRPDQTRPWGRRMSHRVTRYES